jgi:hypothetical protein
MIKDARVGRIEKKIMEEFESQHEIITKKFAASKIDSDSHLHRQDAMKP